MRHALIVLCLATAACSSQTLSPTSPSGVAGVAGGQTQAKSGGNVEVTFTKWFTGVPAMFPAMAGVTGGDVPGTFVGALLSRVPFDNGTIAQLEARYEVIGADKAHSFVAHIEGNSITPTQKAALNGTVISGWLVGAQVHVTFERIVPPTGTFVHARGAGGRQLLPGHDSRDARALRTEAKHGAHEVEGSDPGEIRPSSIVRAPGTAKVLRAKDGEV